MMRGNETQSRVDIMAENDKIKGKYTGQNRRQDNRRQGPRREEIRFEPSKKDRRKGKGRRESDGNIWDKTHGQ